MGHADLLLKYAGALLLIFVLFVLPLPYVVLFPGSTISMGEIVPGGEHAHLYTVSVREYENPYAHRLGLTENAYHANLLGLALATTIPAWDAHPSWYATTEEAEETYSELFRTSTDIALALASSYTGEPAPEVRSAAGPSAALMIALEIINQHEDLARGRVIVGTGTLDANGTVGPVGGIRQKIAAIEKADILIVPEANCGEALEAAVPVRCVGTLEEAVAVLAAP